MNYKNVFKRETKIIAIAVICMAIVLIGGSYALFFKVNQNSNNQVVEAGSLVIKYDNGNTIEVLDEENSCLMPMDDESGSSTGGCKFTLSIHNNGTLPMNYNLLIYDDHSALPEGGTFVDHNYIKYSLSKIVSNKNSSDMTNLRVQDKERIGSITKLDKDNKKILETSVLNPYETVEYTLKIWIDEEAPVDIIGQYIYLKLDVSGEVNENEQISTIFSDYLVTLAQNDSSIEKFDHVTVAQTKELLEYRYIGSNPNNYVCLSDEENCSANNLYRVIGVIPTQSEADATYTRRVKLIKDSAYSESSWGEDTNWSNSALNITILNQTFWDSLGDYQAFIDDTLWYLGTSDMSDSNVTSAPLVTGDLLYAAERSHTVKSENPQNVVSKIGLMYASDFAYSLGINYRNEKIYDNRDLYKQAWIYKANEWTLNSSSVANEARFVNSEGYLANDDVTASKSVRPVFYLKANVKKIQGDGSLAHPYRLGI